MKELCVDEEHFVAIHAKHVGSNEMLYEGKHYE